MLLGRTGVVGAESGNQAQPLLHCLNFFVTENHTISVWPSLLSFFCIRVHQFRSKFKKKIRRTYKPKVAYWTKFSAWIGKICSIIWPLCKTHQKQRHMNTLPLTLTFQDHCLCPSEHNLLILVTSPHTQVHTPTRSMGHTMHRCDSIWKKVFQGKKILVEMAFKTMSKFSLGSAASILFQLLVINMCTEILGLSRHGKQQHDRGSVYNASQALEFVFEVGSEEGDIDKERK